LGIADCGLKGGRAFWLACSDKHGRRAKQSQSQAEDKAKMASPRGRACRAKQSQFAEVGIRRGERVSGRSRMAECQTIGKPALAAAARTYGV